MPKSNQAPSPSAPSPDPKRQVVTKAELALAVHERVEGISKTQAADLVHLIFETMKETLGRGEKIKISGFGNFTLRDKQARKGRNPKTEHPMIIRERRVLTFRPSQVLRHDLNADPERVKA